MNKRVLILSTSTQKGSYADIVSGRFIEGTMMNDNSAYQIFLRDVAIDELEKEQPATSMLDISSIHSTANVVKMMEEADVILFALSTNSIQDRRQLKKIAAQHPLQQLTSTHKEIYILMPTSVDNNCLTQQPTSILQALLSSMSNQEVKTIPYTLPKTCMEFNYNKTMQFAYELGRSL